MFQAASRLLLGLPSQCTYTSHSSLDALGCLFVYTQTDRWVSLLFLRSLALVVLSSSVCWEILSILSSFQSVFPSLSESLASSGLEHRAWGLCPTAAGLRRGRSAD